MTCAAGATTGAEQARATPQGTHGRDAKRRRERGPAQVKLVRPWADRTQGEIHYMTHTATMTPEPQRMRALGRANEIRLARAELKRRIAGGDVSAADVILAPPREASTWALRELLMSQRRWGSTRCTKFLSRCQINETKTVGALTDRQRRLLASQLATCASREFQLVGVS